MAFAAFSASEGRYGGERGRKRRMGVDRVSYGFGPVCDWPPWRSPRFPRPKDDLTANAVGRGGWELIGYRTVLGQSQTTAIPWLDGKNGVARQVEVFLPKAGV